MTDRPYLVSTEGHADMRYPDLTTALRSARSRTNVRQVTSVVTHAGVLCAVVHTSGRIDLTHHAERVSPGSTTGQPTMMP